MHAPTGQARGLFVNLLDRSQPKQAEALVIAGQLCDALDEADSEIQRLSMTFGQKTRQLLKRVAA